MDTQVLEIMARRPVRSTNHLAKFLRAGWRIEERFPSDDGTVVLLTRKLPWWRRFLGYPSPPTEVPLEKGRAVRRS